MTDMDAAPLGPDERPNDAPGPDGDLVEEMAAEWAVRPEQAVDIDQIHELHRAAFSGAAEAELVDAVRASGGYVPELSLVAATSDGSVIGHILLSQVGLEQNDERQSVLALAPLAVLAGHRNRGIGSALMRGALASADERPEPFVVVLGSPAFFGRFGFVPAADFGVTGPYEVADELYQIRPRPELSAVPAGRVVYPPTFSEV